MFRDLPLPLDWPVYVSQAEAKAYAKWEGKSLPTEAEWQRAAYCTPRGEQRAFPWGNETPAAEFGNFNFHRWDPAPVNAFPAGESAFGVQGMVGNGWEWTSTKFAPFPGFKQMCIRDSIRVAVVVSVGLATIAAAIGAGGLGEFIFRGLAMVNNQLILAGAIPAAIMALSADFGLGLLERRLRTR